MRELTDSPLEDSPAALFTSHIFSSTLPGRVLGRAVLALGLLGGPRIFSQETPHPLPGLTVEGQLPEGQRTVGPYDQPRWSARGRFSSDTDVYVLPPWEVFVDVDYQATIPRHGQAVHLFTQELELGLPHRFQIAYENNVEIRRGRTQVTEQVVEGRYALADWGKIPLNPTLFAEYKFGVGLDYEGQEDDDDELHDLPDAFEVRLLLGEQFGARWQWALNLFHEQQLGGEYEWETGFSQALTYAIRDEKLKVGLEMQYIAVTDEEERSAPRSEFNLGPAFTWKPTSRSRFDVAALFGTTEDSPGLKLFTVFSYSFGREDSEAEAPVSTRNR